MRDREGDSPDAAYYDVANRLYYLGNGGVSANMPDSQITIFSVDQGKIIGSISIPGNNIESMGVDNLHHRLYVNILDKHQVGVVDLEAKKILSAWTTPDLNANTALAVDPVNERFFVAGWKPGVFYVFDRDGNVVSRKSCVNINDDMTWDPRLKRVYISGTQGLSIFRQNTPDTYTELGNVPTDGGKTSYYVPQNTHRPGPRPGRMPARASCALYHYGRLVSELIEARDEKKLLRFQKQIANYELLIARIP
jgi:hypothetical protein